MVYEITGDALAFKDGVICHQTNYHGVMGAGIAAAIRQKLLTGKQYAAYCRLCRTTGRMLLGRVQYFDCPNGAVVANCFCQDEYLAQTADQTITHYGEMRRCLINVRDTAETYGKKVYIPYKIGCGIAGGDWKIVRFIIDDVFKESTVEAYIVRRPGD